MSTLKLSRGKQSSPVECCQSCRYYLPYEDLEESDETEPDDLTGSCRRYPPVLLAGVSATSSYPDVAGETGWCGEYTPRS